MRTGCDYVLNIKRTSGASTSNAALGLNGPFLMARSPQTQIRLLNETVELRCLISHSPGTEIHWMWKSAQLGSVMELTADHVKSKYNEKVGGFIGLFTITLTDI